MLRAGLGLVVVELHVHTFIHIMYIREVDTAPTLTNIKYKKC